MLRAYEHRERIDSPSLHDPAMLRAEMDIAMSAVNNIPSKNCGKGCKSCGGNNVEKFFDKWSVDYDRCNDCETIYANIPQETMDDYRKYPKLVSLRTSEEYQNFTTEKRTDDWKDLLDWVSFRCFRYLGKNNGLSIYDVGNRYAGLSSLIRNSELCSQYSLSNSILGDECNKSDGNDVVLCFDWIQQSVNPLLDLKTLRSTLKKDGLLFLGLRMGTGFEMLMLKENAKIFPYEHIFLPSEKAIVDLLNKAGFQILDYTTPGQMDVWRVKKQIDLLEGGHFTKSFIKNGSNSMLDEFQRFLQKSGMSSYARIVARGV